jgi:hypothetical protein
MRKLESMIQMVLSRLERISVDSHYAHLAGGVRGSLLRSLDSLQSSIPVDPSRVENSLDQAYEILEQAAAERAGRAGLRATNRPGRM